MSSQKSTPWYQFSVEKIADKLKTDLVKGLSGVEAVIRQKKYGENVFEEEKKVTIFDRIFKQLKNPLVVILLIAGIATLFLGKHMDTIVILLVFLINIIVGVAQESRASKAFEKLLQSQEKNATVIRDGEKKIIPSAELVVGDIIEIIGGSYIPADVRIVQEQEFSVNESALTGEWVAVSKDANIIEKNVPITSRSNMAWMGTLVVGGTATAIVVGTGNNTQVGKIAESLIGVEDETTPLQRSIANLARFLAFLILGLIFVIFLIGLLNNHPLIDIFMLSIAIAVAAMPQGLPAAVTVVLAIGMESILKKGGLVRNLLAAETLGSTTVILTDKTGTLTMAEMRVAEIITLESVTKICGGEAITPKEPKLHSYTEGADVLKMAMLVSDAFVEGVEKPLSEWVVRGRPVERAIILAGLGSGLKRNDLLKTYPQLDFLPFESKRRMAASLHSTEGGSKKMYISGAPEFLLQCANFVYTDGKTRDMTDEDRSLLSRIQQQKSSEGMRLIAVGYKETNRDSILLKEFEAKDNNITVDDFVFGGFLVLHDPLRKDVREAMETAKEAGTRVIMLTGDNPITALKIAKEAGVAPEDSTMAITGVEVEEMNDKELLSVLKKCNVFARVLPYQKLRIVQTLKADGEVVAMTGDGINDAPALRSADIGIALNSGTEVAKEASDLILLNNSFSIIIRAIEEGRRILDNLKKIVAYLLSTSFGEIIVVGTAVIAGTPIPLLPTQILWTKMVQEGFMNFAFAFEPKEKGIMKRNPRDIAMKTILTPNLKKLITLIASVMGIILLLFYFFLLYIEIPEKEMRTLMFIALSSGAMFFAFSIKNLHRPIWEINFFSNKYLIVALFLSMTMLILVVTLPPLQALLSIVPPSPITFISLVVLGFMNLVLIEIAKYIFFKPRNGNEINSNSVN